jgi:glutamate-1-semialdehyde 2,1-aminomutase
LCYRLGVNTFQGTALKAADTTIGEKIRALPGPCTIEKRYRDNTPGSAALMHEAAQAMPGGNTRTTSFHPPYSIVIDKADGPWVWDVDGRRYVDLFCNGLSLIHGNNYGPAREAMAQAAQSGTAWPGTSRPQIAFAQLLQSRIPALESLRFTNSGSEAGMLAVKAARHVTGRPYLVKSYGAYHGSYPDLEAGLYGQGELPGRAMVAPFNDLDRYETLMKRRGGEVAAIVIEPVLITGRVVAPEPGFLHGLERLAREHGALVILDDCLMLRLAVGGSAEYFSLQPDMVVLGKFLGGGTALGAFGGSRDVMKIFDPTRPGSVFHGGSFNGNPVGCSAGLVTLRDLTAARIEAMDAAGQILRDALSRRSRELGLAVNVTGIGSVAGISFSGDPLRHEDDPSALGLAPLFHLACLNEGVFIGPGGIFSLSTVHDEEAIAVAIAGLSRALQAVGELVASL